MSDPGHQMDFREFSLFVCTRLMNFLKTKNRVDAALTTPQLILSLTE